MFSGELTPVIVAYSRTAIGSFNGALKKASATHLGAEAIKGALWRANVQAAEIGEVFMGNVLSAGVGQAPATQAVIGAGLGHSIPSTTINKVCASGMKAAMLGARAVAVGETDVVVCGGMESMSRVPHYLAARAGVRLGDAMLVDGCVKDGLWNAYDDRHMGSCADLLADEEKISREQQDDFAELSYERARDSQAFHETHIVPVDDVKADEEPAKMKEMEKLKPAFGKDGTVTAGNASKLNDGAAALLVMSKRAAKRRGLEPLCEIVAFADAQTDPVHFTTAPALAIPKALERAQMGIDDIDLFEINEAFSVVALANAKLLDIDVLKQLNIHGGAVALGHPIGASGARIVGLLAASIHAGMANTGVAAVCNGGGGASAVVLTKVSS